MNFWTYRRRLLDNDLEKAKDAGYMDGTVLDVGGGERRGTFKRPADSSWIVLDVNRKSEADILADTHHLPIKSSSIDNAKCTEVLQYLENPDGAIREMGRVLKTDGNLILSVPFNLSIMLDSYDLQRFTDRKLEMMLKNEGFEIKINKKQGLYFTVLFYMIKQSILNMKSRMRWLFYWTLPLMDVLVKLDDFSFVKNSKFMSSFTIGFFVVAVKRA